MSAARGMWLPHREPTKAEIELVMRETGMAYIQARNHMICRLLLQQHDRRVTPRSR